VLFNHGFVTLSVHDVSMCVSVFVCVAIVIGGQ